MNLESLFSTIQYYYFLTLSSAAWAYVVGAAEFGRERTFYGSKLSHLFS